MSRFYMPELGIFLSRDFLPSPNKYRAFKNDPVNYVDSAGLECEKERADFNEALEKTLKLEQEVQDVGNEIARETEAVRRLKKDIAETEATIKEKSQWDDKTEIPLLKSLLVYYQNQLKDEVAKSEMLGKRLETLLVSYEAEKEDSRKRGKIYLDCLKGKLLEIEVPNKDGFGLCVLKCMFGPSIVNLVRKGTTASNIGARIALKLVKEKASKEVLKRIVATLTGAGWLTAGAEFAYCWCKCAQEENTER